MAKAYWVTTYRSISNPDALRRRSLTPKSSLNPGDLNAARCGPTERFSAAWNAGAGL